MAEDQAWLAQQPSDLLTVPAVGDSAGVGVWLGRAERVRAVAAETPAGATPAPDEPVLGHRGSLSGLRDRWLERGYLTTRVTLADSAAADRPARVVVEPGPIMVEGAEFPGRARLLERWLPRPGDPFDASAYREAVSGLVASCAERGYPFPVWVTRRLDVDADLAEVRVTALLVPGPLGVIGPQSATLESRRGEEFLIRAAGIRSGNRFRESDLRRGVDRLLARDLYTRVDAPQVYVTASRDTVGLLWRVQPRKSPNRVAVVLGLSRPQDGGTRLSGQVDLDFPNLAGTGRRLTAGWSDDGQDRSHFGFSYLEPLVMGTPLDTDIALDSEVLTDIYTRFTLENTWRLPVVSLWGVEAGFGWDRTTYPDGDVEGTRRLRARLGLVHNRGDRARSGWSASFGVENASRSTTLRPLEEDETESAAASRLGSQDNQRLLEGDLAGELWLRPELSVAAHGSYRRNDADTLPVPLAEQYRFGGATTLRGYREDEFHGETAAWGGVEVRLGRVRRSRVYTFVDVGYFEFSVRDDESAADVLATRRGTNVGFGLGLLTVGAPGHINLAVGFPGDVDFETAKLHVSLLGSF